MGQMEKAEQEKMEAVRLYKSSVMKEQDKKYKKAMI